MGKEAVDAVVESRIATGIFTVAAAVICSSSVTEEELELAGKILLRDPKRSLPREIAGAVETFNRHMDAAIESCNESAGAPTRAARRARLASDLERAGLVLIDHSTLAELLERKLAGELCLEPFPDEDDGLDEGEELGAELADGEEPFAAEPWDGEIRPGNLCGAELELVGDVGRNPIPVPARND